MLHNLLKKGIQRGDVEVWKGRCWAVCNSGMPLVAMLKWFYSWRQFYTSGSSAERFWKGSDWAPECKQEESGGGMGHARCRPNSMATASRRYG